MIAQLKQLLAKLNPRTWRLWWPPEWRRRAALVAPQEVLVARIVKAGGRVIAGTDAPINPYGLTLLLELERPPLLWAIAGGIALTVAVSSLFHALSLGPANVVVPIYGMFIVGGSLLGVLFLGEPMAWHKIAGLIAAVIGVILIAL